jgi:hypothetical protein
MTAALVRVSMDLGTLVLVVAVAFVVGAAASIVIDWWWRQR